MELRQINAKLKSPSHGAVTKRGLHVLNDVFYIGKLPATKKNICSPGSLSYPDDPPGSAPGSEKISKESGMSMLGRTASNVRVKKRAQRTRWGVLPISRTSRNLF